MKEEWADVQGYEGLYKVSSKGRVTSLVGWAWKKTSRELIMTPFDNGNGYLCVSLRKDGKRKNFYVHRLVADAFVSGGGTGYVVDHIDFDKQNNSADNLVWTTQKENVLRSVPNMKGKQHTCKTNSGEPYISMRKTSSGIRYRVTIQRKEYPIQKTLQDAVKLRDIKLGEHYDKVVNASREY